MQSPGVHLTPITTFWYLVVRYCGF